MTKKSTRLQMESTVPPKNGDFVEPTPNGHGVGLAEWRKQKTVDGTLPSGLQVTLRKVKMLDLIGEGHVPTTLDALVKKATSEGFGVNEVIEFLPLVDAVVKACLIKPAVTDELIADETHLALAEIPVEDRLAIFSWANAEATQMRPFREQPRGDVESSPALDGVSPAA